MLKYANINNNNSTNLVCNTEYYVCKGPNVTNFAPYDSITKYLRENWQLLSESTITSLSLFNQTGYIFLNLSQFGIKNDSWQNLT
jgi:hypothetical protein